VTSDPEVLMAMLGRLQDEIISGKVAAGLRQQFGVKMAQMRSAYAKVIQTQRIQGDDIEALQETYAELKHPTPEELEV